MAKDPRRKTTVFTFVEIEEDEETDDIEEVLVFDLFSKLDCKSLWQRVFQDAVHIVHGSSVVDIERLRQEFYRNVYFLRYQ